MGTAVVSGVVNIIMIIVLCKTPTVASWVIESAGTSHMAEAVSGGLRNVGAKAAGMFKL